VTTERSGDREQKVARRSRSTSKSAGSQATVGLHVRSSKGRESRRQWEMFLHRQKGITITGHEMFLLIATYQDKRSRCAAGRLMQLYAAGLIDQPGAKKNFLPDWSLGKVKKICGRRNCLPPFGKTSGLVISRLTNPLPTATKTISLRLQSSRQTADKRLVKKEHPEPLQSCRPSRRPSVCEIEQDPQYFFQARLCRLTCQLCRVQSASPHLLHVSKRICTNALP
jgi:hypothetical protein